MVVVAVGLDRHHCGVMTGIAPVRDLYDLLCRECDWHHIVDDRRDAAYLVHEHRRSTRHHHYVIDPHQIPF